MAIALPPTIARFIEASNARDLEAAVECFAEEAVLEDEGRTHRGIAEVRAWKQARSNVEGRKAQEDRSVETEDESVTGSVFLFNVVTKCGPNPKVTTSIPEPRT